MKTKNMARKGGYFGAVAGLLLFAIIGLLPSSFIGGVLGLKIAGNIFGTPLGMELLPRVVVGLSMVLAVLVTGLVFVIGISMIGWLSGLVYDTLRADKTIRLTAPQEQKDSETKA
jgi:hypothetical protein